MDDWTFVSFEYCLLFGRGSCDGLITRPEESYRVCPMSDHEALSGETMTRHKKVNLMKKWP